MTHKLLTLQFGALVVLCLIASAFFLRYWSATRDRFFLWFAAAFATLSVNWVLLGFQIGGEYRTGVFVVRLVAFLMIIAAIVGKNAVRPR
jgi:hypothetical protein